MSKEGALKKHYPDFDIESGWMFDGSVESVFKAMDEYANEILSQAIEVVKEEQKEDWGYPADKALEAIINKLNKLKK